MKYSRYGIAKRRYVPRPYVKLKADDSLDVSGFRMEFHSMSVDLRGAKDTVYIIITA